MQLLRLGFEGIGPFTSRHAIDFAALSAGGLFLLEGPTGAGKTTIIDALVFALYGDVAGADSSKARLVSTQLPPGVEPYVDAVIETARGLYRVRRVPQHARRKSRGPGTTVGKASIKLWKLASPDDEGVLLSTSLAEASEELQRALGLTKEQFTQTVVLPQGHFATFLRAKPEDRRSVLQDIFGTEFYARCARELADLAAGLRAADADARAALDRAESSFATVAWPAGEEGREGFVTAERPVEAARVRVGELAAESARAEGAAAAAATQFAEADEALRLAVSRNETLTRRAELQSRLAELAGASAGVGEAARVLDAAERAEQARRPLEAAASARAATDAARAEAARALAQAADGPDSDLVEGAVEPEALETASVAAREARSALTHLVETESGLASRAEQLRLGVERLAAELAEARRLAERVDRERAEASGLGPELQELLAGAATRAGCLAAQIEAKGRMEDVHRLETLAAEFLQARTAEQDERERAAVATDAHQRARASWLGGLAGTLAGELAEGRPCPVCGSRAHPEPAARPDGVADREEVERLESLARQAERLAAAAQARSDSLATAMSDQQHVVGDLTRVEAELALAEAAERTRLAELAAVRADELRARVDALLAGAAERERRAQQTERRLAAEKATLQASGERLESDRERVAAELAGFRTLAERSAALGRRAERAARLAALLRQAASAELEFGRRDDELSRVLAEQGFADAASARAALLDAPERRRLRARVDEHRAALTSVRERLSDERFAGVDDSAAPVDEGPLRAAAAAAREALLAAQQAMGAAGSRAGLAATAADELVAAVEALAAVRERSAPYLAMADLAAGGGANELAVTLPTFVLLRRFEEVVDFANVRLDAMTGGRYSLRRTDAREGRSHKLGLGLEVVDHASGDAARDPKTLSGGETFQASLAMALGLADAVTAEAGGIELSTLFVDEGFGSLDAEALDMVMDQLTALRDGGRCVGVVSHVAELKQRIAERVTVLSRRDGTSTLSCSTDPQPALAG